MAMAALVLVKERLTVIRQYRSRKGYHCRAQDMCSSTIRAFTPSEIFT